ncbi:MAG: hypothetical protein KDB79_13180, partial [Acidobacteria bacterium]|nr:hypothetical protein [Acidobacteriota bacterium]
EQLIKIRSILKLLPDSKTLGLGFPLIANEKNKTDYGITAITDNRSNGFFSGVGGFVTAGINEVTGHPYVLFSSVLAIAALTFIGIFGWPYLKPSSDPQIRKAGPSFTKLTNERLPSPITSISPDGKLIAYVGQKHGMESLRIRQVTGSG